MFDRTEPAIGRTRPADGSDFFREIAAVCRPFLFALQLSLPSPHRSDVCASAGRRISPDTPDLRILHANTCQNLEEHLMSFKAVECGMRIRSLREKLNCTQNQFAEQLNVSLDQRLPNLPGASRTNGGGKPTRVQPAGPKVPSDRQSDDSTGYSAFIFYQRVPQIHTGDAQSGGCETFVNRTERENFERQRNYSGQDDPQHNINQTDHRLKI